jgi:hypothetical protein
MWIRELEVLHGACYLLIRIASKFDDGADTLVLVFRSVICLIDCAL